MSISKPNHNQTGFLPAEEMREIEELSVSYEPDGKPILSKGHLAKVTFPFQLKEKLQPCMQSTIREM